MRRRWGDLVAYDEDDEEEREMDAALEVLCAFCFCLFFGSVLGHPGDLQQWASRGTVQAAGLMLRYLERVPVS